MREDLSGKHGYEVGPYRRVRGWGRTLPESVGMGEELTGECGTHTVGTR